MDTKPAPTGLAEQVAALSDALARQRLEFQEAESSLVTRIADVDDDRRLTTNRLQRAWQTHHDEINARLKRQQSLLIGGLLLLALLFGIAAVFAYAHVNAAQRALRAEQAQLRADYAQLVAVSTQDTSIQESLDNLRKLVADLSKSLTEGGAPTAVAESRADPVSEQASSQTSGQASDQTSDQGPGQPPAAPDAATSADSIGDAPSNAPSPQEPSTEPSVEAGAKTSANPGVEPAADPAEGPADEPGARQDGDAQGTAAAMARAVTPATAVDPAQPAATASAAPDKIAQDAPADPIPAEPTSTAPAQSTESEPDNTQPIPPTSPSPEPDGGGLDAESPASERTAAEKAQPPEVTIAEKPLAVGKTTFALQLIGFYSLDDMISFARREQLPARVYYREESYQGRPWFVLIHSLHSKKSDASEAMAQLPKELAMLDTFIRSFSPEAQLGVLEIER